MNMIYFFQGHELYSVDKFPHSVFEGKFVHFMLEKANGQVLIYCRKFFFAIFSSSLQLEGSVVQWSQTQWL